jgi:biopolymer transport protein ExbB
MNHLFSFSETIIVDGTLCMLGCFSLVTWSVIFLKTGEIIWHRFRNHQLLQQIHGTVSLETVEAIDQHASNPLAVQAGRVLTVGRQNLPHDWRTQQAAWHELIERALRQQIQKEKASLDGGLGWLASIGSTSPFIGLFGTVWGIMHALKDIGAKGNASLEVVAGPIGEALIATALGIAVAIPAVIAYNVFLRQNRQVVASLEHVATDFLRSCIENDLSQLTRQSQQVI